MVSVTRRSSSEGSTSWLRVKKERGKSWKTKNKKSNLPYISFQQSEKAAHVIRFHKTKLEIMFPFFVYYLFDVPPNCPENLTFLFSIVLLYWLFCDQWSMKMVK